MSNTLPEGWHKGTLTDLAEINPRLEQRADLKGDTPVSFIKMEDVSNNASIKNVRTVPYQKVSKGFTSFQDHDVLLAKITPCFENGKGGYVQHLQGGVGFGSTEFHLLRARSNSDSRFLFQYTNYPAFRLDGESNMTGSAGQRRVPTEFLRSYPIFSPPLPEQQKIATILSSVDNVIETTRAQIDKLKDLKTGMMQELLTKGIGHTEFKDSPVGRIPASWDTYSARELLNKKILLKLQDGNHGSQYPRSSEFVKNGTPYIAASHISEFGEIDFARCPHLSQERADLLRIRPAQSGDVILTHNATVGRTAIIPKDRKEVIASTSTTYYRTNPDRLLNRYLFIYFQSTAFVSQLQSIMGQTTRNQVPITAQRELQIVIPSVDEQLAIAEISESVTNRLKVLRTKFEKLQVIKKALMQDLLTGKVRVKIEEQEKEPAVV